MTISKVLYTLRGATRFMLPQFFRESDGEPVLLEGEKGVFVQMVHSTGEVISRAKPMPIEVVGGASEINPISVPLQTGAASPDFGSSYTPTNDRNTLFFSITGTSTSRTISFEMKGPNGQYISTTAYSVIDPSVSSKSTTGGSTSNPEHWVVYIPAGYTFRTNVTAVVGGTVDVSGTAAV